MEGASIDEIKPAVLLQIGEENAEVSKKPPFLKYTYKVDQWSPLNQNGKKVYDREFLINLSSDPNSKVKPLNLPDLEVVLKDNSRDDQWSPLNQNGRKVYNREFLIKLRSHPNSKIKPLNLSKLDVDYIDNSRNRSSMNLKQFKDMSLGRHDGYGKMSEIIRRPLPPRQGVRFDRLRTSVPVVTEEPLFTKEVLELKRQPRLKFFNVGNQNSTTDDLYNTVRAVLNKLMPQTFDALVNRVKALEIDSQEKLQRVVDMVFTKAVDEPNFVAIYARLCKELSTMRVSDADKKRDNTESDVNFRTLIITRCVMEFEEAFDENDSFIKRRDMETFADPICNGSLEEMTGQVKVLRRSIESNLTVFFAYFQENKHRLEFTEKERRIRIKSLGNIRFIGELFKQDLLTTFIMHRCICYLLALIDDESLECLCKLLRRVGQDLESRNQDLDPYFKQMLDIVNHKTQGNVSVRVRFMLQDVFELRINKWVPRKVNDNSKAMNDIQKNTETKCIVQRINDVLVPREEYQNIDRKQNCGGGPIEETGWNQPVRSQQYSVEMPKLENKPPPMDNLQLGNKNMFQWSRNVSADAPKTVTPNKFAMLENMSSEQDKRSALPLSGSRSTGLRDYGQLCPSLSGQLSMDQIHERLLSLMSNEKENSFDNISSWISANVGARASEPQFIKLLMSTILEASIGEQLALLFQPYNNTWKFMVNKFQNLQALIHRYIDADIKLSELQCLIAIQEYIHQLNEPQRGFLLITAKQIIESILSFDVFDAFERNRDLTPLAGKSVAMLALKSFFISLEKTVDEPGNAKT